MRLLCGAHGDEAHYKPRVAGHGPLLNRAYAFRLGCRLSTEGHAGVRYLSSVWMRACKGGFAMPACEALLQEEFEQDVLQLTAGHLLSLPVPSLCAISKIPPVYKRVGKLFLGIPIGRISTLLQVTPRLGPTTLTTPAAPLCIAASASQCAYATTSLKRVSCQCAF